MKVAAKPKIGSGWFTLFAPPSVDEKFLKVDVLPLEASQLAMTETESHVQE